MSEVTIWHNPRCSKSRETLALLNAHGLQPVVVEYLKNPPSAEELKAVLKKLHMRPREFMRKGEALYKELGLADESIGDDKLIAVMVENPVLIERPVVLYNARALLGRPPENVLDLFTGL
jgi:arsenate reductase